jgi:membrane protease YdiL (CAAX protease family)
MSRRHPLMSYFALACGISWMLWAPLWLPRLGIDRLPRVPFQHALGALGPIAAAFIVSAAGSGMAGPADLLRRMGLWRGRLGWVAVALLAPFGLLALAALGTSIVSDTRLSLEGLGRSREFPQFSPIGFVSYNLVTFGYGEEVGWRGFALPRLQARHSALVASLLLTVGWAIWHAPLFLYRPEYVSMGVSGVAGWLVSLMTGAILLTWLYNESKGSLLVVALFHATVDVAFTSDISSSSVVNAAGALITIGGILVIVLAGPRYLSRRGKVVRMSEGESITGFVSRDGDAAAHAA